MGRCVVGMQERWDETVAEVLPRWFPWLDVNATCPAGQRHGAAVGNRRQWRAEKTHADLPAELLVVLRRHNRCDLALHELGRSLFERQLEVARAG